MSHDNQPGMQEVKMPVEKVNHKNAVYHFSIRWSLPHANRTQSGIQAFRDAQPALDVLYRDSFDKFVYQLELTDVDNWHYQGYAHARTKVRCDQLGLRLGAGLGTPVTCQEASVKGKEVLRTYCMKPTSRQAGPWADHRIYLGQDLPTKSQLYPWQRSLLRAIESEPDDRSIFWVIGQAGNQGKTKFAKYLAHHHKVPFGAYGKAGDLLNLVSKKQGAHAYVFDLTRCKPADFGMVDLYATLESIKNGMFINLKYSTEEVIMMPPHVLVFSNHEPDIARLSADRWCIWEVEADHTLRRIRGHPPPYVPPSLITERGAFTRTKPAWLDQVGSVPNVPSN